MPSHCSSVIPIQYYMLWSAMCMYCGQPFLCLITQILQQEYTTKYIFCRVTVKYLILKKIKKKILASVLNCANKYYLVVLCTFICLGASCSWLSWYLLCIHFFFGPSAAAALWPERELGHSGLKGRPPEPPFLQGLHPCTLLLWAATMAGGLKGRPPEPPFLQGLHPCTLLVDSWVLQNST